MIETEAGSILEEIGQQIANLIDGEPEGAFMYAEAGDAWAEASIFLDQGNIVQYYAPDEALFKAILKLWETTASEKRWATMSYSVLNGRFEADFGYPNDIDPKEFSFLRCQRALAERYGEKPVDYTNP